MPPTYGHRQRVLGATVAAILGSGLIAAPAFAGTEHYFSGGLSPSRIYASATAHTNLTYSQSVSDHTACPGQARGAGGYFYLGDPGTTMIWNVNYCGPGTVGWNPPDDGLSWHGAVLNPNVSTNDHISDAHYSW